MADQEFILAPVSIVVGFDVHPVHTILHSQALLTYCDMNPGLDRWIIETAAGMSAERKHNHELIFGSLYEAMVSHVRIDDFSAYIDHLAETDPTVMRDRVMDWMHKTDHWPGTDAILGDVDVFMQFLEHHYTEKDKLHMVDMNMWREVHAYLNHPAEMRDLIINHLRVMWDEVMSKEWARIEPMLQESAAAFREVDFTGLTALEAAQLVTGRDFHNKSLEKVAKELEKVNKVIFSPSAHIGPYVGWLPSEEENTYRMIFGARLPDGINVREGSTAVGRSEMLVRLNALADDTRLRMLELLTQHEELCAQDFITLLDLSQSSASRHLRQLTATGFVKERRREVSKCYSLSLDRVDDTLSALKRFLHGN